MKLFITAVPLFDSKMDVLAYMLKSQNANKLFGTSFGFDALDGVMNSPTFEVLDKVGVAPFTGGKPIFVEISKFLLLMDFTTIYTVSSKSMICTLTDEIPMEDLYIEKCIALKNKGFLLALKNIAYNAQSEELFKLASYIIIDYGDKNFKSNITFFRKRFPNTTLIIANIIDAENFENIKPIPNILFEGTFYTQPVSRGGNEISPLRANSLELLKLVNNDDVDLDKVSQIIQQDLSISISLLKFINSPAIGLTDKVNSIQSAVALLGQKEMSKWIATAVATALSDDKHNEISKLSLIRAKFAENLATYFVMDKNSSSLFLMGLFSLLDVILAKPMKEAILSISVTDDLFNALVNEKGPFADVLHLIYCYEQADWQNVSYLIILNNVAAEDLHKAYLDALIWYKELSA